MERVCILCGEKMWRCIFYGPLCVEGSWRVDLGMSPFIDDEFSVDQSEREGDEYRGES
jgi:hypothetical protein